MSTGNYPSAGQPEPGPGHYDGGPTSQPRVTSPVESPASRQDPAAGQPATTAPPATNTQPAANPPAGQPKVTRAGVVWAAVVAALVVLILLIIFIMQNQDQVVVRYFGLEGMVPLGMALFIASVTGGVLVAMAGGARILQLRRNAHRARAQQRR
ncbi:DUF1049 domain-containing protein [Pseudarthrobacter phenanthrenivorans]|uniref:DUF1049 domain-containing protein n=1 Tax=Pseudarthrobacter phenanthrenivorans TaxID=361575 RepID=A0A3B0FEM3_PSEPS|nr:lipopolysaccharide assembly protein LapA domain-containing protein [Pseudarthrobacter phenanthrenivorans]RKO23384.1 DUF1049 domain-containing protein [Pseudarthrobacter phenanthrenivorans]